MKVSIGGSADLNADDLEVISCVINASGSSDATIYVTRELEANASGSSDIVYRGNPEINKIRASGSADISER